ncbi:MAG: methyltransferase domain-containing protein [Acidobacteria bacterium]|nr:methyltransferase domain-containing protein [Acidobacteriota bacterium]
MPDPKPIPAPLEFTGERLVPGEVDPDLFNEHMARYAFAARLARNKRVLDIGCGAGYGSAHLAQTAEHVLGLDVSEAAVESARGRYQAPNLQFLAAPAQQIPLDDHSFDLIVAFEVIEHLEDWPALLDQARRLLAPGGQFVVSTPNRDYYAETRRLAGPNPFHVHEFDFEEFRRELSLVFPSVTLFLQNHVGAITFQPAAGTGNPITEMAPERQPAEPAASHFFLAVCAMSPQTGAPLYVYVPSSSNVLREREQHIAKLEAELAQKDAWLEKLKTELSGLHTLHEKEVAEHAKATAWALGLETELETARRRVVQLQEEAETDRQATETAVAGYEVKIGSLEAELAERTREAVERPRQLEAELAAKLSELSKCVELLHAAESTVEERTLWARQLEERIRQLEQAIESAQGSRWLRLGRRFGVGPDLQHP